MRSLVHTAFGLSIIAATAASFTGPASGAGFALIEHSAQGMGNAFAGGAAIAEDASTVFFNPAGMTLLQPQVTAGAHLILPSFEFTDRGSFQAPAGTPLSGDPTSKAGVTALVPNLYYVRDIDDRLVFGLGINVPFGLETDHDDRWVGRYHALKSEILTFNVNPSLAYKVHDKFSVGAGVSAQYIDATLTNAIDFPTVCASRGFACGTPGTLDGRLKNEADDLSFGYNLGLLFAPSDNTRFGLAYRSQIEHKLTGTATFSVPAPIAATPLAAVFANDSITADVDVPATVSLSGYHRFSGTRFALMGDATWTGWSSIEELRIRFGRPTTAGGPGVEDLDWKDTVRLSAGLSYYHSDRLTLRLGAAYDESPVPDNTKRTPRLPDSDRYWATIGASYRVSDKLSVDVGYAHLFLNDSSINRANSTGAVLVGGVEADVNIFSTQVNYAF